MDVINASWTVSADFTLAKSGPRARASRDVRVVSLSPAALPLLLADKRFADGLTPTGPDVVLALRAVATATYSERSGYGPIIAVALVDELLEGMLENVRVPILDSPPSSWVTLSSVASSGAVTAAYTFTSDNHSPSVLLTGAGMALMLSVVGPPAHALGRGLAARIELLLSLPSGRTAVEQTGRGTESRTEKEKPERKLSKKTPGKKARSKKGSSSKSPR